MNKYKKVSKVPGILINMAEILLLVWFLVFNGNKNLFHMVIAWNWISYCLAIFVFSSCNIILILGEAVKEEKITKSPKELEELDEKIKAIRHLLSHKNRIRSILNGIVIFLIAYSGSIITASIFTVFTIVLTIWKRQLSEHPYIEGKD